MGEVIDYVKVQGTTPERFNSWQAGVFPGQDTRALRMIDSNMLEDLREQVRASRVFEDEVEGERLVIMEGFLLYNMPDIRKRLDTRLFVKLSHQEANHRRMTRPHYGAEAKEGEFLED